MTGPLFDVYLAVDWSARSAPSPPRPSPDSVWVAEYRETGSGAPGRVRAWYLRTRHDCRRWLRQRLVEHARRGRRVLVGFDFPFGYPRGFAAALGLGAAADEQVPPPRAATASRGHGAAPWRLIWDELDRLIEDAPDNRNNRFEVAAALNRRCAGDDDRAPGPLWGCPRALAGPSIRATSPGYPYRAGRAPLSRLRWAEQQAAGTQPAWKLMGIGSAGSQCLLGIPVVSRLRSDPELADLGRVWPFETGSPGPARGASVLYAEIWPGIIRRHPAAAGQAPAGRGRTGMIKDEAQVRAVVRWLRSADGPGSLRDLLAAPGRLPAGVRRDVLAEEGWILGF